MKDKIHHTGTLNLRHIFKLSHIAGMTIEFRNNNHNKPQGIFLQTFSTILAMLAQSFVLVLNKE